MPIGLPRISRRPRDQAGLHLLLLTLSMICLADYA